MWVRARPTPGERKAQRVRLRRESSASELWAANDDPFVDRVQEFRPALWRRLSPCLGECPQLGEDLVRSDLLARTLAGVNPRHFLTQDGDLREVGLVVDPTSGMVERDGRWTLSKPGMCQAAR